MPRIARHCPGGFVYHVLNRGVGRMELFSTSDDYAAWIQSVCDVLETTPMRVLGYCVMPNHWHLVLWPRKAGELAAFMQRLTITHVRRWVEYHQRRGYGPVYQGRFKSFPVQNDDHLLTVLRYVERNPVRARLVKKAERWAWSSLGQPGGDMEEQRVPLSDWPIRRPSDWLDWVNTPQTPAEENAVQASIIRSRPLGTPTWITKTSKLLNLPPLRPIGRPKKEQARK